MVYMYTVCLFLFILCHARVKNCNKMLNVSENSLCYAALLWLSISSVGGEGQPLYVTAGNETVKILYISLITTETQQIQIDQQSIC